MALGKSLYFDKTLAATHLQLGCCHYYNGQISESKKYFENVLKVMLCNCFEGLRDLDHEQTA